MGGGRRAAVVPALLAVVLWGRRLPAEWSPCPEGTFRDGPGCVPCHVCDEGREYKEPCRPTADAVCTCPLGRECGGNTCVPCQCGVGHQRKGNGCESCPEGAFNDLPTGPCRPWSRNICMQKFPLCAGCSFGVLCRCPGNRTQTPGTKERDVVCKTEPKASSPTPGVLPTRMPGTSSQLVPIAVAVAALVLCLLVLLVSSLFFRSLVQEKLQGGACVQPAEEVDDCSCGYPEEEEGGSGDSAGLKGGLLLLEKVP